MDIDAMSEEELLLELERMRDARPFPAYPSAIVTVHPAHYEAATEVVRGLPRVFLNGATIMIPETEVAAIEWLRAQFGAKVEYGAAKDYEFANKAAAAGVRGRLVRLGTVLTDLTGKSIDDMVKAALDDPDGTYREWAELYHACMIEN